MDDAKLKKLLEEDLERDAERIMAEVNADPSLKDVKVPDEIHDNLMKRIREYEAQKAKENLSEEDKELIRLGKVYRKNRKRNRILVALVAVLIIATFGMTSIGEPVKMVETVKRIVSGREQTRINVEGNDIETVKIATEEEAYQAIEDAFEVMPVRLYYLPDGMAYTDIVIEEETQNAGLYYEHEEEQSIVYAMLFNYRPSAAGVDVEDEVVKEYEKQVNGVTVCVKQYSIANGDTRWRAEFEHQKVKYFLSMSGFEEKDVGLVLDNLYFPKR